MVVEHDIRRMLGWVGSSPQRRDEATFSQPWQQAALIFERLLDRLENLLADAVLLEQMTKIQNRGLIGNPLRDHVDPRKAPEAGGINQHLLHQRIR